MLAHPLTNFEIQKYQNEPRFNVVYSRDKLSKRKDGAYVINLDENSDIGSYWVALYVQNNVTYFDSFVTEHIPKEIKTLIIKTLCEYFFIGLIDFMLARKTLTELTNLF